MLRFLSVVIVLSGLVACSDDPVVDASECFNTLSQDEQGAGWRLLFDGKDLSQWRSYREAEPGNGWGVENGCLVRLARGGDLITRDQFGDFELKLEWRISEAGNSGIFIRGDEKSSNIHHSGFEMQILDNERHSDRKNPTHRAGAWYDMIAPDHDTTQPAGSWNQVHIIARGPLVEFRLNGRTTARLEQGSAQWRQLYQQSKFTDRPRYGTLLRGHVGLQDHWDKVWFRNIRVLAL